MHQFTQFLHQVTQVPVHSDSRLGWKVFFHSSQCLELQPFSLQVSHDGGRGTIGAEAAPTQKKAAFLCPVAAWGHWQGDDLGETVLSAACADTALINEPSRSLSNLHVLPPFKSHIHVKSTTFLTLAVLFS